MWGIALNLVLTITLGYDAPEPRIVQMSRRLPPDPTGQRERFDAADAVEKIEAKARVGIVATWVLALLSVALGVTLIQKSEQPRDVESCILANLGQAHTTDALRLVKDACRSQFRK